MPMPEKIAQLAERFKQNEAVYRSGQYNEPLVRKDFIDPMFACLGWDMDNRQDYAQAYRDVIHEDAIDIDGSKRAPDYCFRVGGVRKFFLEAKKPSVNVRDDVGPAYQLRRYAWSAKLPLSILTDFEEFAVYDCRTKPSPTDKAAAGRILYLKYTDYEKHWDDLAGRFSKDAILKGAFDKYAESTTGKRGTATVDAAFLAEIEAWRDALARNIALRNPGIDQRGLNDSVQRTIDRIIFLRLCEDRGIEEYGRLKVLSAKRDVYEELKVAFQQADDRYNSGLFHFHAEKGRADYDGVSLGLSIDDKVLKPILGGLYYPDSPYEFSVLPADILGQVYEQFLGKVIRLTAGHQAKVEEKPEVRKAGGVYYTPTYIVDYIVQNTVGKLLEGETPADIDGSKPGAAPLRVLDPACGSGSFLIVAYQFLLDWHLKSYLTAKPEKLCKGKNPKLRQHAENDYALTIPERKRILLEHIYGVDIDPQAVEVTKLSLLLKVLEGETAGTLGLKAGLFHERALPDLDNNIKCGNSLIGPDFYHGQQTDAFDSEEMFRINAFDWKQEFPFIVKDGGFDAVVGNPPYIRIQTMKEWAPKEVGFYKGNYLCAAAGNYDIYIVFVEKGLSLLNANGRFGFIVPSKFFTTDYGAILRGILSTKRSIYKVVDFRHQQVFPQVSTYTCLLFAGNEERSTFDYIAPETPKDIIGTVSCVEKRSSFPPGTDVWSFHSDNAGELLRKLREKGSPLIDMPARIARGSSTGADDVFLVRSSGDQYTTSDGLPISLEDELLRIPIFATAVHRYAFNAETPFRVIYPYISENGRYRLIEEAHFERHFPKTYSYMRACRKRLQQRKQSGQWYGYSAQEAWISMRTPISWCPYLQTAVRSARPCRMGPCLVLWRAVVLAFPWTPVVQNQSMSSASSTPNCSSGTCGQ